MTDPQVTAGLSRPLAAYRLGLLSHTYPLWRDHSFGLPEFQHGTPDCAVFPLVQMERAVVTLAREIPVNVYGEIMAGLRRRTQRKGGGAKNGLSALPVARARSRQPWPQLTKLADLALEP